MERQVVPRKIRSSGKSGRPDGGIGPYGLGHVYGAAGESCSPLHHDRYGWLSGRKDGTTRRSFPTSGQVMINGKPNLSIQAFHRCFSVGTAGMMKKKEKGDMIMAHSYKNSGGGNMGKNPYTPGSWDWIQYQNKLAFQDRLKAQLEAKKESPPEPQGRQLRPQPGPPPNTPAPIPSPAPAPGPSPTPSPLPVPGPLPTPSLSPIPGPSPTPSPIPEPTDSGARNPVSNALDTIADFKEALKNNNIQTMRTKAEEFFEEDPKFAANVHYNNQYDLILMDDQFHVLEN